MARVQEIRGMAEWYATDIASSTADWMKYLDTASHLCTASTGNCMCIPGIVE